MPKVEVPLVAEAVAVEGDTGAVVRQRARRPLARAGVRRAGRGVPDVLQEDMARVGGQAVRRGRIAVVDRAHDDEGVALDAVRMRGVDEVAERLEGPAPVRVGSADG